MCAYTCMCAYAYTCMCAYTRFHSTVFMQSALAPCQAAHWFWHLQLRIYTQLTYAARI
jgi:hypothetical protein